MQGCNDRRLAFAVLNFAMRLRDLEAGTEKRLRCNSSKTHDQLGSYDLQFSLKPRPTSVDLLHARFFVDPKLASRFPFEVFDCVCNVDLSPLNIRLFKALIKQLPSGTDKGMTF